jgi:hypothetical protein
MFYTTAAQLRCKNIFLSDLLHMFFQDPQVDVEESKYLIKQITESIQRFLNNTLVVTTLYDNTKPLPYCRILFPKFHKKIEIRNNLIVNIAYGNRREHFQIVQILQNDLLTIPNR